MAESSPYRDDRTADERTLGASGGRELCVEISDVRVEDIDLEAQVLRARLSVRVRLDDVARVIDRALDADPHLLRRLPHHLVPTARHARATGTHDGTHDGTRNGVRDGTLRGWPRGGSPSWRPDLQHAGDLGAATGRTVRPGGSGGTGGPGGPGEEDVHTVPGHEVLDVEAHVGTDARPMAEQAAGHSAAPHPDAPARPYLASDQGTTPDPGPGRSTAPHLDGGPGRSTAPHPSGGPRPGLDPPPQEPPHSTHRARPRPATPSHPPAHHTPQGHAQPRPGRAPAEPGTETREGPPPWSSQAAPREPGRYRPGLDPPPDTEGTQPPRHAREAHGTPPGRRRTNGSGTDGGRGAGTGRLAENKAASGNGVSSRRLGGIAAGWS
ncbi:hypothetical protein ACIBIZ_24590 [Nonomuraea spiralis]|uniref:hypothetical protein n=1 Tax=Nonomuraea spiralis TaxID=46182 RepID=UPI0037B1BC46